MKKQIFNFFENKLSDKETEALFTSIKQSPKAKQEYIEILNFKALRNAQTKRINKEEFIVNKKYNNPQKGIAIAFSIACIVLLCIGTNKLYNNYREEKAIKQIVALTDASQNNNAETQAVLELSIGTKIDLHNNSAEADKLTTEPSTDKSTPDNKYTKNIIVKPLNTINVTGKKDYLLTMNDGSRVWLRPNAKLSFPDKFENGKRYVELEGEAYFSVAKDSLNPFIIKSSNIEVKVLGTEFNLLSSNGNNNELSMVSGTVSLSVPSLNKSVELKANQQAIINSDGNLSIKQIDSYKYKAWIEGYFVFINQDLQSIVKEISKWYNVDIRILSHTYDNDSFNGKISVNKGMDQLIKTLQLSYGFHFYMENNILYIK